MLMQIRDYCAQRGLVSLQDLVMHFQVEADVMRQMLEHWIRKGTVCKHMPCGTCGSGCGSCNAALSEFYQWVDLAAARPR